MSSPTSVCVPGACARLATDESAQCSTCSPRCPTCSPWPACSPPMTTGRRSADGQLAVRAFREGVRQSRLQSGRARPHRVGWAQRTDCRHARQFHHAFRAAGRHPLSKRTRISVRGRACVCPGTPRRRSPCQGCFQRRGIATNQAKPWTGLLQASGLRDIGRAVTRRAHCRAACVLFVRQSRARRCPRQAFRPPKDKAEKTGCKSQVYGVYIH